ncbi:hypothetical protein A2V54_02500 [candidate division WWE3 bacterium RBG_19FT_COMBO_53_11]|uniref:ASCH domain-containing protein n=1 Tax=candidate division WWE3 bacterium RBG_19FT_COMBO_53_11 TaxID=1802613 RepID=A0A1F4UH67_UNCKA|nr:MAG: hypothetical protein A2V54_02500 [candidate division WWE3 bacterium RBG_19FT_COMBO_53_11]
MKKSWGLTEKILSGQKTIESRWYANRSVPWDKIAAGDTVYFKNSGEPVTIKATVGKVLQFSELTPKIVQELLYKYGHDDGLEQSEIPRFFQIFKDKKYSILIFLKDVSSVAPFEINKRGFGAMAAWISVDRVSTLKKR